MAAEPSLKTGGKRGTHTQISRSRGGAASRGRLITVSRSALTICRGEGGKCPFVPAANAAGSVLTQADKLILHN
jgi:hypothetical protein